MSFTALSTLWVQVFNQNLACHKWTVGPAPRAGATRYIYFDSIFSFRFYTFRICPWIVFSSFFVHHHVLHYGLHKRDLTGYSVKGCVNTDFYPKLFTLCSFIHSFIHSLSTLSHSAGTGCHFQQDPAVRVLHVLGYTQSVFCTSLLSPHALARYRIKCFQVYKCNVL